MVLLKTGVAPINQNTDNLSLLLLKKMEHSSKDPLHGKRLDTILEELIAYYQGFEKLGEQIRIKCFTDNPSISSSLKFLRKTPWARTKVESLYLYVLRQQKKAEKGLR